MSKTLNTLDPDSTLSSNRMIQVFDDATGKLFKVSVANFSKEVSKIYGFYVNAKQFGAKGDGITDDSEAISQALQYWFQNECVLVFEGTFKVTTPITLTLPANGVKGKGMKLTGGGTFDLTGMASNSTFLTLVNHGLWREMTIENLRFRGGSNVIAIYGGNEAEGEYFYHHLFSNLEITDFTGTGMFIDGSFFESVIFKVTSTKAPTTETGKCFHFVGREFSTASSVEMISCNTKSGEYGVLFEGLTSDFTIIGGTYLFAVKEGIYGGFNNGYCAMIRFRDLHLEGNNRVTQGAAIKVIGNADLSGCRNYSSTAGSTVSKSKYLVEIYATAATTISNCLMQQTDETIPFKVAYLSGVLGSSITLVGNITYDSDYSGNYGINTIGKITEFTKHRKLQNYIPFSSSITPNLNLGNHIRITTVTGNLTINNPSSTLNPFQDGDELLITFIMNSTGGYTVSFGSNYELKSGYTVNTAANARNAILFVYTEGKWLQV